MPVRAGWADGACGITMMKRRRWGFQTTVGGVSRTCGLVMIAWRWPMSAVQRGVPSGFVPA